MHSEEWNKSLKGPTNCAKIHNELARKSTIVLKGNEMRNGSCFPGSCCPLAHHRRKMTSPTRWWCHRFQWCHYLMDDVTSLLAMCFSIGEKKSRFQRMNCLITHIKTILLLGIILFKTKSGKATPNSPTKYIYQCRMPYTCNFIAAKRFYK